MSSFKVILATGGNSATLRFTIPDMPKPGVSTPQGLGEKWLCMPSDFLAPGSVCDRGVVAWKGHSQLGVFEYHDMEYNKQTKYWQVKPGAIALAVLDMPDDGLEAVPLGHEGAARFEHHAPGTWRLETRQIKPW